MHVVVPREVRPGETRAPILPESVAKLVALGGQVEVEPGIGSGIQLDDSGYASAGAQLSQDIKRALSEADMVLRLGKPRLEDVDTLKPGCIHVSYLDPFNEHDLVRRLAEKSISAISMEMIPRTTLAQKMDALSSQANLTGYVSVILAADALDRVLPMMMTPAGTLAPARVFVIGVGVAGLQAIATAKRLGARVEAFDTRPAVEEQVKSLGARFVKIDLGETGQTKDGYAKALTDDQIERQRNEMAKHCANADVVITTAQVFGRKAPVIVTSEMLDGMRPGSIVVDCAMASGGNVEDAKADQIVERKGVKILGLTNMPAQVAFHASQMYSSNLYNLIEHFWDQEAKALILNTEDEIMDGCLITQDGAVRSEKIRSLLDTGATQ